MNRPRTSYRAALALIIVLLSLVSGMAAFGYLPTASAPAGGAGSHLTPKSAPTYTLTFSETGLAAGTSWTVSDNTTSNSSTTSTVGLAESNGTVAWSITPIAGYSTAWFGNTTINGTNVTVPVNFSVVLYPVYVNESGLPSNTSWTVGDGTTTNTTTGRSNVLQEPNGTVNWHVLGVAGYTTTWRGSVTVSGDFATVSVTFSRTTYTVTFSESGLSSGTSWTIDLNGTNQSASTVTNAFTAPNGTYAWSVAPIAGYTTTTWNGTVTVNGTSASVAVAFTVFDWPLLFVETGLPASTNWTVTVASTPLNSTTSSITFGEPNGTFAWSISPVPGYTTTWSGSATINGASTTVPVAFVQVNYSLTFTESGLGTGTNWSVTVGATTLFSTSSSIAFTEPNGTYAWQVGALAGYTTVWNGSATIAGSSLTVNISFSTVTYLLTFSESGLPTGTNWSVTILNATLFSTTSAIVFEEPNGSYAWQVGGVPGYSTTFVGNATINGANLTVAVAFSPVTYSLTFNESGLPSGTNWSVRIGATTLSSTTSAIVFSETNGSYAWQVLPVAGYTTTWSGSATVTGAPVSVPVSFSQVTYSLTFNESGLPAGTSWSVKVGGTTLTSTTSSIVFTEPNGTYLWQVGAIPGYTTTWFGNATVNGSALSVAVAFTQVTYAITFAESGLPSGTNWSVTIGSTSRSSTTSSLAFTEPNGSYAWSITPIAGYSTTWSGSATVNGASIMVNVSFATVTYSLTFTETGLPAGTSWSVTIGGTTLSSTTTTIVFSEPNGTYAWSITPIAGYSTTWSGSATVSNGSASVGSTFTQVTYTLTFTESGLPTGTNWTVTIGATSRSSTTSTIVLSEPNGTYSWSITPIPGYATAYRGSATLSNGSAGVTATFTRVTYTLTFTESGLPSGTSWTVTIAGSPMSSTTTTIVFTEPNGTYAWQVSPITGYSTTWSGSATINGGAGAVSVPFAIVTYALTFNENGLPTGTSWTVSVAGSPLSSTGSSIVFAEPNGTFAWSITPIAGYTTTWSGSSTLSGAPVNVSVTFTQVTYTLTFSESGLPSGTSWTVTVGGSPMSSTTSTIGFTEPNGTYAWRITPIGGYTTAWNGNATVNGASVTVSVTFTQVTYAITFTESGLPSGTSWSVTIGASLHSSTTSTILFNEPNGSYTWTISPIAGYTTAWTGSATVTGAAASVGVTFTQVVYTVTFTESGLPSGTSWSVTIGSTTNSSTTSTITLEEPNGTFAWSITPIAGYTTTWSGSVSVNGAAASVSSTFTQLTYGVSFQESGLASGTSWTVTVGAAPQSSTGTTITFSEPNGTYAWSITPIAGYTTVWSGSVTVSGGVTSVSITFTRVTYTLKFTESGLASGTSWTVTVAATPHSSTTSTITFTEPNGSYAWSITPIPGYRTTWTGSASVAGANATVASTFTVTTYRLSFVESGLPVGTNWTVTAGGGPTSSTSTTIALTEPNGTYPWTITPIAGYTTTWSGSAVVNGANRTVSITFSQVTYTLRFNEVGLPVGTQWTVTVGASSPSTTGSTLAFTEPNGTYAWSIAPIAGYTTTWTGSATVNGANVTLTATFTEVTYGLSFHETGLPTGTNWSVTIGGSTHYGTGSTLLFTEPNGSYSYTIGAVPGYSTSSSGTADVQGGPANVTIAFGQFEYTIQFTESGLPSGTSWKVTIGGSAVSSTTTSLSFAEPNGSYAWTVTPIPGYTTTWSGSSTVNGGNLALGLTFTQVTYALAFTENGLPTGTMWTVTIGGSGQSSSTNTITFTEPNGTYAWSITPIAGYTTAWTGSASVNGANVPVTVTFTQVTYLLTFTESGLPTGTSWTVTIGGNGQSSTTSSITFVEPNGTYAWTITPIAGYTTAWTGSATVNGANTPVSNSFTEVTYTLTFTESGLPSGTSWTVTIAGTSHSSTTTTVSFTEPNGTYAWTITPIAGYTTTWTGSATVNGGNVPVAATFTEVTYTLTFTESGLPSGTSWTVTIAGSSHSSTTTTVTFTEPNGTDAWTITPIAGYTTTWTGSATVNGGNVPVTATFTEVTYTLTFTESGLPSGTSWTVTIAGSSHSSTTTTVTFTEPNGTYAWSITPIAGYSTAWTGSATVNGASKSVSDSFTEVTYTLTFTESGLPSGTSWTVTIASTSHSSTTTTVSFTEPNGTYAWTITAIAGYTTAWTGSATVNGANKSVSNSFTEVTYTVTFTESGLPSGTSWTVTISGSSVSSSTATLTFAEPNGSLAYQITGVPGYNTTWNGNVGVAGANASIEVEFTQVTYSVLFTQSGLPGSVSWTVTIGSTSLSATGASLSFSEPNGSYAYAVTPIGGYRTSWQGNLTVQGKSLSIGLLFGAVDYTVTFQESGLPTGTLWIPSLAGNPQPSTTGTALFSEPNGSYPFQIAGVPGYTTSWSGNLTVNGSDLVEPVLFVPVTYSVSFDETGLASGATWTVTIGGSQVSGSTPALVLSEMNGTYAYTITPIAGYTTAWSGMVTVSAGATSVPVTFLVYTYGVTFRESGLPTGTAWTVEVGGGNFSSTTSVVTAPLPNGTARYAIVGVAGFTTNWSGSVDVAGSGPSVAVDFQVFTYALTFSVSGLPSGSNWSVTIRSSTGATISTASVVTLTKWSNGAPTITFEVGNGTYSYDTAAAGYVDVTGSLSVAGATPSEISTPLTRSGSSGPGGPSGSMGLLGGAALAGIAIAVVAALLVAVLLLLRRRRAAERPSRRPPAGVTEPSEVEEAEASEPMPESEAPSETTEAVEASGTSVAEEDRSDRPAEEPWTEAPSAEEESHDASEESQIEPPPAPSSPPPAPGSTPESQIDDLMRDLDELLDEKK